MQLKAVQVGIVHSPAGAAGLRIEAYSSDSPRHDGEQDFVVAGRRRALAT